jgi:hypothetical protein
VNIDDASWTVGRFPASRDTYIWLIKAAAASQHALQEQQGGGLVGAPPKKNKASCWALVTPRHQTGLYERVLIWKRIRFQSIRFMFLWRILGIFFDNYIGDLYLCPIKKTIKVRAVTPDVIDDNFGTVPSTVTATARSWSTSSERTARAADSTKGRGIDTKFTPKFHYVKRRFPSH